MILDVNKQEILLRSHCFFFPPRKYANADLIKYANEDLTKYVVLLTADHLLLGLGLLPVSL